VAFVAIRWATGSDGVTSAVAGDVNLTRQNFTQTWTGSELVVWGGWGTGAANGRTMFGDGAAYDPSADAWRPIAEAPLDPRWGHAAFWDGDEVVIVGGVGVTDGAAYDPKSDSWRKLDSETPFEANGWNISSTSSDGELIVWEGPAARMWSYSADADEWTDLPKLPMTVVFGRVAHVDDQLLAVGLPAPTQGQQVRTAALAADRAEWRLGEELDGSAAGEIDIAVIDDGNSQALLMWGSATAGDAWRFADDFTWQSAPGPGLTPCDGAPEPAIAGDQVIVRSFCDDAAMARPTTGAGEWTSVDFPSDSDPAPVWTGTEFVGLGVSGEIYRWR